MTKQDKKIIMAESDEAASIQTVTGWVSSTGRFWGNDERMARYDGSTHKICEENPVHGIVEQRSWCKQCRAEKMDKRWQEMPKEPFAPDVLPVHVFDSDRYFFLADELAEWLEEHNIKPEEVRLTKCEPKYPDQVDPNDIYADDLPEDGEIDGDLWEAFEALNEVIKKSKPLSWHPIDVGVNLPADFLANEAAS